MVREWWLIVPGTLIVLGWIITFRWLVRVQNKVDEIAERVARLEGFRR